MKGDPIQAGLLAMRMLPNADPALRDKLTLRPGDRVRHITFGEGEILSAKPMGSDILFEVMFDTAGTKKLMGTYAKLKRVE